MNYSIKYSMKPKMAACEDFLVFIPSSFSVDYQGKIVTNALTARKKKLVQRETENNAQDSSLHSSGLCVKITQAGKMADVSGTGFSHVEAVKDYSSLFFWYSYTTYFRVRRFMENC